MLFRRIDGKLIEINKYNFKNDKLYYEKIMNIHTLFVNNEPFNKNHDLLHNNEKPLGNNKTPLSKL